MASQKIVAAQMKWWRWRRESRWPEAEIKPCFEPLGGPCERPGRGYQRPRVVALNCYVRSAADKLLRDSFGAATIRHVQHACHIVVTSRLDSIATLSRCLPRLHNVFFIEIAVARDLCASLTKIPEERLRSPSKCG